MITLRDYQDRDVYAISEAWAQGHRRVAYVLPTGGGKTRTFSHITQEMYSMGMRVLILCHRREILDQISLTLNDAEVPHSILCAGMKVPDAQVIVGSIQTVARRKLPDPQFIVVDEMHHLPSRQFTNVINQWPKARFLGVTATPERLDGKGLRPYVDHMHLGPTSQWLMDNGYLARTQYWAPETPNLKGVRKRMGDFDQDAIEVLMSTRKITGNAIIEYEKHAKGLQAIAFCCSVKHATEVAEAFTFAGYPSECIHAGTTDRKEMMERFRSGKMRVLTNCELIGEGVDVPAVGAAILLRPTASLTLHLQQIGRALRPKPDGSKAIIIDHAGNLMRHGGAEEVRKWNLDGHASKQRDPGMALKQCPKCFMAYVGKFCPECGPEPAKVNPREIDHSDGELKEWQPKLTRKQEEAQCKTYRDMLLLARKRGYKKGWAWHMWEARKRREAVPA